MIPALQKHKQVLTGLFATALQPPPLAIFCCKRMPLIPIFCFESKLLSAFVALARF